jgi:hypothetical protein
MYVCVVLKVSENYDLLTFPSKNIKCKIWGSTLHLTTSQNMTWTHEQKVSMAKVVPLHAMEAYMGRRGIAPLIPNLTTGWR